MEDGVLGFADIDRTRVALVGDKGVNLGELSRVEGVRVPAGFVVTTLVYERFLVGARSFDAALDRLSRLGPGDRDALRALAAEIREAITATPVPDDLAAAITQPLVALGADAAYAVRSSATAEDLPAASFAGLHDSFLNVVGASAIVEHVRRCWASLFTERAVTYRLRNGFDHRGVRIAVIVQRMVVPRAAGVLFTADPVSGHRKTATVEAICGLGEALVSGLVSPDLYRIRDGVLVGKTIASKRLALHAAPGGGTRQAPIAPEHEDAAVLSDAELGRLVALGQRIQAHFGAPQDIEWCLGDGDFEIVQSRPITTLFPLPAVADAEPHVYVSVGHQQMMTDALRPLGISVWQLTAGRPMYEAAGRLFVDVARALADPATRAGLLEVLGRSDPLIKDALETLIARGDLLPAAPASDAAPALPSRPPPCIDPDPALVNALIGDFDAALAATRSDIIGRTGLALIDFILADLEALRRLLFDPRSQQAIMTAVQATWWLREHLAAWLGEPDAADVLAQSAAHNITAEMGLDLLRVADAIRPHPEVVAFLEATHDERFLAALPALVGGADARAALEGWLDRYGMRCAGEIDITTPRWRERPLALLPTLLGHVRNLPQGVAERRFARGLEEATAKEREVLERLRALPDGEAKADETRRMIDRVRAFIGYREYPKYAMIGRYFVYKQALLGEAERLVQAGVLQSVEDVFHLTLQELREVVRTQRADAALVQRRRDALRGFRALTPPRVMTSDGEILTGRYQRSDVPAGALVGLAVSAGTVEGRVRVVVDFAAADLEPGDILVTTCTDPSWTPLFVAIKGLVTEVGGLMTHGSVIAREYGLPAVVGVEHATRLLHDGQRIRVNGSAGFVEILT